MLYEVDVKVGLKELEALITPSGQIVSSEHDADDDGFAPPVVGSAVRPGKAPIAGHHSPLR